ncbi:unnamed protein product [Phytophthora lilii]|uniref:Unnamed protein product n=1 Tax=Phytophthora lilii TaxID=2077276 RepID=A0A9W6UAF5_9STRA|nr:unnamed protein product [Phytophthora lilii]
MLKRILKRRTKIKMMEDMFGVKRQKTLANQTDSVNILHEMLRSTAEVYVGVDNYFSMKDINQLPYPGKTRMANRHAINDIFLEIVEKQMLPFPAKKTESAVWGALGQLAMQQLQCVKDINARFALFLLSELYCSKRGCHGHNRDCNRDHPYCPSSFLTLVVSVHRGPVQVCEAHSHLPLVQWPVLTDEAPFVEIVQSASELQEALPDTSTTKLSKSWYRSMWSSIHCFVGCEAGSQPYTIVDVSWYTQI